MASIRTGKAMRQLRCHIAYTRMAAKTEYSLKLKRKSVESLGRDSPPLMVQASANKVWITRTKAPQLAHWLIQMSHIRELKKPHL